MSLMPLVSSLLNEFRRPTTLADLYDQHFGLGLWNDEVLTPLNTVLASPLRCGYLRPSRNLPLSETGISSIQSDKNEFRVNLDVQQFKPEELKVKVAEDVYLVVEGRHEERSDQHGFISRQFTRRYKIPEDVDQTALVSNLSSDGVLTLKAPKKTLPEGAGREIPITQTNQPTIQEKKSEKSNIMDQ